MPVSRRQTLRLISGGTIIAAASAAGFLTTRTPARALAPWDAAGSHDDPRLNAQSFALLAPNPHNRQPWLVELIGTDTVILHRDTTRDLPHTDPDNRQIFIGLGCFLEQMVIAASAGGHTVALDLFPQGDNGPVARATFSAGAAADPLASHILDRRSCKEPFAERPLPEAMAADLAVHGTVIRDPGTVGFLKELSWRAWLTEMRTPRALMESVDLMRFGKAEINANPDGIDLGGPFLESLMLVGVVSRAAQADPRSTGFREGVRIYKDMLAATPAYILLKTTGNSRRDQIDAGRQWLRLNLDTTRLGLALHPISQALQEYPEMAEHRKALHSTLAEPGETIQMLGRVGFGPKPARTPRWPLETRMING